MTVLTGPAEVGVPLEPDTAEIMSWRRTYAGRADQAREVRRFVGTLLADLPNVDDVIAAAAELFGNAIGHTRSGLPGGHLTLEVRRWPGCGVTLSVTDQGGPGEPRAREPTDDLESGRGLTMLSAFATAWGWHGDVRGRTVTAIFLG